jgi:hypothetical protein
MMKNLWRFCILLLLLTGIHLARDTLFPQLLTARA